MTDRRSAPKNPVTKKAEKALHRKGTERRSRAVPTKGGRPTKYRHEYADRLIEFCAQGYSLTAFAGEIGVCRDTISEWAQKHPEFSASVSRAKAKRALWWEKQAINVAQAGGSSSRATMVIFGLKNHAPEDYRDKAELEHKVAPMTEKERAAEQARLDAIARQELLDYYGAVIDLDAPDEPGGPER